MIRITFQDRATERQALAFLLGRFSGRVLKGGEHLVPESALEALASQNISFTVKGKTIAGVVGTDGCGVDPGHQTSNPRPADASNVSMQSLPLHLHLRLILCILSLLLAAVLLPLWYRSHHGPEFVKYASPNHWFLTLTSGHGTIDVLYIADWPGEPEFFTGRRDKDVMYATRYGKRFLGFGTAAQTNGGRYVVIPYWFLVTCCIGAAAISARSWRRRRRLLLEGRCKRCGYDLRATPERCPECGTVAT